MSESEETKQYHEVMQKLGPLTTALIKGITTAVNENNKGQEVKGGTEIEMKMDDAVMVARVMANIADFFNHQALATVATIEANTGGEIYPQVEDVISGYLAETILNCREKRKELAEAV